ncbi:MAG: ABC transporter [Clostridiales bacterium]|nr:MAG: ABC transporter [Clostridiales bacterium]
MIELQQLGKTFYTRNGPVEAVREISLKICDGDIFGIIGLSGAGKSTLVRCINFLERPTEGRVLFDGTDLGTLSAKQLREKRRQMSMIFQGFNLLAQRTVLRNVCFPLEIAGVSRREAAEKARGLLEMVGLSDKEQAYPGQLSGGQKQRVAIARALATDPKVLLCDEATSALDPTTTHAILELLQNINRKLGVTIIVITHEMRVVEQICNRVAVLDNSRVVEEGAVKDIFLAPRSKMAKALIMPENAAVRSISGSKTIRIVFDGNSAFEPVISNLSLECRAAVNILMADTKNIEGRAYGQMLLQLPEDEAAAERIRDYLKRIRITFEEGEL